MASVIERARAGLYNLSQGSQDTGDVMAVEDALTIVERLPVTADGVPVLPVSTVWCLRDGMVIEAEVSVREGLAWEAWYEWGDDDVRGPNMVFPLVKDCYSTRAAAESAREAKP